MILIDSFWPSSIASSLCINLPGWFLWRNFIIEINDKVELSVLDTYIPSYYPHIIGPSSWSRHSQIPFNHIPFEVGHWNKNWNFICWVNRFTGTEGFNLNITYIKWTQKILFNKKIFFSILHHNFIKIFNYNFQSSGMH